MPMGVYARKTKSIEERMKSKLVVNDTSGCWEWTGAKDRKGYGRVNHEGTARLAHRIMWTISNGKIPEGRMLCHKCDNRSCCNPDHLYPGEHIDNVRDMMTRRRFEHGERHHAAVLPSSAVKELRELASTHTDKELAARFGISPHLAYLLRTRRSRRFEH